MNSQVLADDQRLTTNDDLTPTVAKTAHPPERTTANHPPHTSAERSDPRPCQMQTQKLSWGRTRCPSRTQTRWDRPSRNLESQSTPSACTDGTAHYPPR